MVGAGLAWHFKQYAREQAEVERWEYAEAEEQARNAKRGLQVNLRPLAPWDSRTHSR